MRVYYLCPLDHRRVLEEDMKKRKVTLSIKILICFPIIFLLLPFSPDDLKILIDDIVSHFSLLRKPLIALRFTTD